MSKVNSGQAPSTLIPKYIGSDFDKVIAVADNIESVVVVGDNIEDVVTVADNIEYVKEVAEDLHGMPVTMHTGAEAPLLNPMPEGMMWYCTTDGRTYVWYTDEDSGQWVESAPQSAMHDEATNIFFHAATSNVNPAYRSATLHSIPAPAQEIQVAHNLLETPVLQAQFIRDEALWVDVSVTGAQGLVTLMGYASGNVQMQAEVFAWEAGVLGNSLGQSMWVTMPSQPTMISLPVTLANIDVLDAGDSYVVKLTSKMVSGGSAVSTILVDGNTSSRFGIIFDTNLIGLYDGVRDGVVTSAPTENAVYDALRTKVGKEQLAQAGEVSATADWAPVPAFSDPELGGPDGPLNAQAKALAARSELFRILQFPNQFFGSNGSYVRAGDIVPAGTTRLNVLTGIGVQSLFITMSVTLPATISTVTGTKNAFAGYDVVTNNGTIEALDDNIRHLRGMNAYPTAVNECYPEGWAAVGNGVADDRASIQKAILAAVGRKLVFNGSKNHFVTFADGAQGKTCLDIPNNITIDFNGATIRCETNNFTNYQILSLYKVKGVVLNDPKIIGDVDTHTGTTGEAGYGILARSSENVEINRAHISKCWGDGLLLGADSISTNKNVVMNHCVFDDNRRQGSSVGGGVGIVYKECTFSNTGKTKSTAPSAGIDIEPDGNKVTDLDVKVVNCRFFGNKGGAAHVILGACLSGPTLNPGVCEVNVKFSNCTSIGDSSYQTAESRGAIRVGGTSAVAGTNILEGAIDFDNFSISQSGIGAVWLTNPIKAYPPIRFRNLVVNDIYTAVPLGAAMPTSSIIFFDITAGFATTPGFEIGDIDFDGVTYRDTRGLTWSPTATSSNHRVKRPIWSANLDPANSFASVRFRHFKTDIQADSLTFFSNGGTSDFAVVDEDAMFYRQDNASILVSNVGETWGLGMIPIITGTGSSSLTVELPSTNGRVGTYQAIHSHMDGTRPLVFRAGTTDGSANTVIYKDGTRTGAQTTMPQSAGIFRFYCPVPNLWVQQ